MRARFLRALGVFILCFQVGPVSAQQSPGTAAPQPQATTLLAQSAAALSGAAVSDVTLTGTAESIVGSDDETGSVSLKAMMSGQSRMDLSLPSGNRSEVRSVDAMNSLAGSWTGPDGVEHPISYHNLLTDSSWFFPALTMKRLAAVSGLVATFVGQETLNGQSVLHVSFVQPPMSAAGANTAIVQHLTQMDAYLDPTTFLPVALSFAVHPDGNELLDIPVQILFANYQSVNGVQTPFRVQKILNGTLVLDIQVQSVLLNSGLSTSAFAVNTVQ